jgi:hypothetical protein
MYAQLVSGQAEQTTTAYWPLDAGFSAAVSPS